MLSACSQFGIKKTDFYEIWQSKVFIEYEPKTVHFRTVLSYFDIGHY